MVHDDLAQTFLAAQLSGDRQGAIRIVMDAAEAGIPARELQVEVIASAQRELGRLWELNRVTIAQEHLATAIAQLTLARLYGFGKPVERVGWRVVLACVEGEQHDLGPRIASDVLEQAGYDVRLLGANVPLDALVHYVDTVRPQVVCLSATMVFHLGPLREAVARLRRDCPWTEVLVGGWAVEQVGVAPEGSTRAGVTAEDLLRTMDELRERAR